MNKKISLLVYILLTFTMLFACTNAQSENNNIKDENITTELKMCYITFSSIPKDLELVTAEINKITKAKINARIKIEPIIISEYSQQINLKLNRIIYISVSNNYII